MQIAIALLFAAIVSACTTTDDEIDGDPIGLSDEKADFEQWAPTRKLVISSETFEITANHIGHVVRGTFDPSTYTGVIFTAAPGTRIAQFTRSWLTQDDAPSTYQTEPFLFQWKGTKSTDETDWANWSLLSHCCNNWDYTLPQGGANRFMVVVLTTTESYKARAPYLVYLRHWMRVDAPAHVSGVLRCGAERKPLAGATMSIDTLSPERAVTGADGSFAFGDLYSVDRHELYSDYSSKSERTVAVFDAVFAPDDGPLELWQRTCPE